MTQKEFAEFVEQVKRTYRTEKFIEDQETFDTWFPYFENFKREDVLKVFSDYAVNNHFTPQISDLVPKIKSIASDRQMTIENHYNNLEFVWEGAVSMDCREKFIHVCRDNVSWAVALEKKGKTITRWEKDLAMEDWLNRQESQVVEWMQNKRL